MRFMHVWCINLNLLQVKDKVHVLLMFVLQALQQTFRGNGTLDGGSNN